MDTDTIERLRESVCDTFSDDGICGNLPCSDCILNGGDDEITKKWLIAVTNSLRIEDK
jgi:hypothetical protein